MVTRTADDSPQYYQAHVWAAVKARVKQMGLRGLLLNLSSRSDRCEQGARVIVSCPGWQTRLRSMRHFEWRLHDGSRVPELTLPTEIAP